MLEDGILPTGTTLSPGGVISGTPTDGGDFTFILRVTDSFGCTAQKFYVITIAPCPSITIKPFTLSDGTAGAQYSKTISASGGSGPYDFTIEDGSLPTGLTLSTGGVLSGTPTTPGSFTFTIVATDSFGCAGKRQYTINIACPSITVSPSSLPGGSVNHSYSQQITASGSSSQISFAVLNGSLPTGLTLGSHGLLSGLPTTQGSFTFTVVARDTNGCSGKRQYTVVIGHASATVD